MLSPHGEYEFGSPKRPKIQEAVVIHYLDDLSAKVNNFQATLKKENIGEGEWTGFNKMHERYLYRQIAQSLSGGSPPGGFEEGEDGKTVSIKGPKDESRGARKSAAGGPSGKLPLDI